MLIAAVNPGSTISAVSAIEESDQPFARSVIQDHLIPEAIGAGSGVGAGRLRQRLLESGRGSLVVRVRRWWLRPWVRAARDFGFEDSDRPTFLGGSSCEHAPPMLVGFGQKRLAVSFAQGAGINEVDCLVG